MKISIAALRTVIRKNLREINLGVTGGEPLRGPSGSPRGNPAPESEDDLAYDEEGDESSSDLPSVSDDEGTLVPEAVQPKKKARFQVRN